MHKLNSQQLADAITYIESWLQFNFDNSRFPGLQVAVQYGDKLVYSGAFGQANVAKDEELTTNHTFRIASHSKTFTATAIMQLHEAGLLSLDDKVSKYLDWFVSSQDTRVADITIRQLLNHTAGIIRDGEEADYWQALRVFPDVDELKQYLSKCSLVYEADEKFKYSNYGYGYLGQLVEAVSGVSYHQFATDNIISKLDLKNTGPELDSKAHESLATGYGMELLHRERRAFEHIDTKALASATGFYATAEDVCQYFSAHFFGNNTLISDVSKRAMQHGNWEAEKGSENYGLGMVDHIKKEGTLRGHSGGFPGFITETKFDPTRKLVVTALCNSLGGPADKITSSIINIINSFQQDTDESSSGTIDLSKFTGRFYSKWGPLDIILRGNKLITNRPSYWSDFEYCEELSVVDDNTLKIEKSSGYSSPGELIVFTFDEQGTIQKVVEAGISLLSWEDAQKAGWF